jgi:hypothetical protein
LESIDLPDVLAFEKAHPHGEWPAVLDASFGPGRVRASRAAHKCVAERLSAELDRVILRFGRLHDWLLLGVVLSAGDILFDYRLLRRLQPSAVRRQHVRQLAALYLVAAPQVLGIGH